MADMTDDLYYDNDILTKRFDPVTWRGDHFQENAGLQELYERVNARNPSLVIDAGCGRNPHKAHIPNLIGFDPSPFPDIDFQSTILDAEFEPECADVVLSLGSIQFISHDYIRENIDKIVGWCKPGGIIEMRIALGQFPNKRHCGWAPGMLNEFTEKYNFSFLVEPVVYDTEGMGKRKRWTWLKNG